MECELTLLPEQRSCRVPAGTTLQEALARLDAHVTAPCGGEATCGKCRVRATGEVEPPTPAERALLSPTQLAEGLRLACQARICGPAQVEVPAGSRTEAMRILPGGVGRDVPLEPAVSKQAVELPPQTLSEPYSRLEHLRRSGDLRADVRAELDLLRRLPERLDEAGGQVTAVSRNDLLLDVEPGDTSGRCYGLALDLGTTTVVASLVDLNSGRELQHAAVVNQQTAHGHDVIARINHTLEEVDGLEQLQRAALASLEQAIDQVLDRAGVGREEVYEAALVGNATMTHLFLGIAPASLGRLPYVAVAGDAAELPAASLGLRLHPAARVYVLPAIAGFVGADTVGAILACNLDEDDGRVRMVVDIGTNCELVLRLGERLIDTSTPAGPAFEGARISCGMYAVPGAIEEVRFDGDVHFKVIGGSAPRGLCGSALVDVGAELLRAGIVDNTGRLLTPEEQDGNVTPVLGQRVALRDDELSFLLSENGPEGDVVLTQRDIRELQLAKGAIRTAIDLLLEQAGVDRDELDEFYLAGGFGNYIDKSNAMRLGLIPELPPEKLRFVGNGALVGARLALVSQTLRRRAAHVALQAEHLQIADTPDFQLRFGESMLFE